MYRGNHVWFLHRSGDQFSLYVHYVPAYYPQQTSNRVI